MKTNVFNTENYRVVLENGTKFIMVNSDYNTVAAWAQCHANGQNFNIERV